jgi:isoquinoline 1-oxidoreductase subunit beta
VSRIEIPRRAFLTGLGLAAGGLALGIFPNAAAAPTANASAPNPNHTLPEDGLRPSSFVHIAPDGTVSIVCKRSEMGQGVRSSLPVLIADELGADMAHVRVVQATGDQAYGDQDTDGSHSVRGQYDEIRKLGATARTLLIAVAAKKWGVQASACSAHDHKIFHDKTKRSFAFADLVADATKLPLPKQEDVKLRPRSELPHANAPIPILDGKDIVTGTAIFGADVKLPGMLTAVVVHPPVVMGKVKHYDALKALAVPGVKKIVELPVPKLPYKFQSLGGLAVVAENTWAAMRGARALEVVWEHGENATYDSRTYHDDLLKSVRAPGKIARKVGDVHQALAHATKKLEAEYYAPHLAHASMEPPAAVARVDANGCEVWTCTQNPQGAREEVAKALGIDESKVTVHVTLLGGGFGRKSKPDYVSEAALIAREMKVPVRVQWTREDDVQHDYFHSVSLARFVAGLDAQNKIDALLIRSAFPPIGSTFVAGDDQPSDGELGQGILDTPFSVPNVQAEGCIAPAHVRIGWLRSVHNIHHGFAIGSFVDELAHARGVDPKDQWLELLGPARFVNEAELGVKKVPNYGASLADHPIDTGRFRHVVERVAEISGWSARATNKDRALGLSVHHSFLSYIAVVAAVERDPQGKIRVDEAWVVADAGILVNPERVRSQLEGAFIFGTSIALYSQITARGGAIEQSNFRDYRLARIADAPRKITIDLITNDEKSGGVGEPGVPPVAPAIINAVFALTGKRIRELPLVRSGMVG